MAYEPIKVIDPGFHPADSPFEIVPAVAVRFEL
jgi:hypothetical protein